MGSWRDLAADVFAARSAEATEVCCAVQQTGVPLEGAVPMVHPALPDDLRDGIALLAQRPPPSRLQDASAWPQVIADAQSLVRDGWAAKALALGWKGRDLFGVAATGSDNFEGLAVWLRGRPLLLIEPDCAVARASGGRAYFNRGGWGHGRDYAGEVVPLWRFGRA